MRKENQIRITAYSLQSQDGNIPRKAVTHLRAEIIRRPDEQFVIATAPPEEDIAEKEPSVPDLPWSCAGV
jgi:hypothetical protein